jgi:hypothetical protein
MARNTALAVSQRLPRTAEEASLAFIAGSGKRPAGYVERLQRSALLLRRVVKECRRPKASDLEIAREAMRNLIELSNGHLAYYMVAPLVTKEASSRYTAALIEDGLALDHLSGMADGTHSPLAAAGHNGNFEVFELLFCLGCRVDAARMDAICETALKDLNKEMLFTLARCGYPFRKTGYVPPPELQGDTTERARGALYSEATLYQVSYRREVREGKPAPRSRGL